MTDSSIMDDYLLFAIELAKKSGSMMLESQQSNNFQVEIKTNPRDLVTEIDRQIEKFIFGSLKQRFPNHRFIGEESADGMKKLESDEPTWIVDPIDGTMNFVHSSPWCCVSIGLAIDQKLVMGVIYAPFINKLYSAVCGKGARCNGIPIHVSSAKEIEKALLMVDPMIFARQQKHEAFFFRIFDEIIWKAQTWRSLGSCCLSLCFVAEGCGDAFFHRFVQIWDMAAGYVILTEAGGVVVRCNGEKFDPNRNQILAASTQNLADQISKSMTEL